MNCTKCNGSGSEGYISFLRCGRCSGTGKEPADALVPYSDDLIVVPTGPVLTQPEMAKAEKKIASATKDLTENEYRQARQAGAEAAPSPRLPFRPPSPYSYGMGATAQTFQAGKEEKEEEKDIRPISKFFDLQPGGVSVNFEFLDLSTNLYSGCKVLLREICFAAEKNYMVKSHHQGCIILEAFYTGLGVAAKPDRPAVNAMQPVTFEFTPQKEYPHADRMAITLWIEIVDDSRIMAPSYGAYGGHRGVYR